MGNKNFFFKLCAFVLLSQTVLAQQPKVFVQNGSFIDENGDCFVPFGYNYVGSKFVSLLEDDWLSDSSWAVIISDFQEMRRYNANTVRIHLQYNKFMNDPQTPNETAFDRLKQLVQLAEETRLYLLVTGLGAYRAADQPLWYDALDEQQRWATHAIFWAKVAESIGSSNAVFSYDLMNEPVSTDTSTWLPGSAFGNFHFVQNLTRTPNGRTFEQIATAWIQQMKAAIRAHDLATPITVGFIGCGPVKAFSVDLDYISTHIYPQPDSTGTGGFCTPTLTNALNLVYNNLDGKPFVVSEIAPLNSFSATDSFMRATCYVVNGWLNHYGGSTLEELSDTSLLDVFLAVNLRDFKARYSEFHRCQSTCGGEVAVLEFCEPDPDLVACYQFNGDWSDSSGWEQHLLNFNTVLGTGQSGQSETAAVFQNPAFSLPLKFMAAPDHSLTQPRYDQSMTWVVRLFPQQGSPVAAIWAYDDIDGHDGDAPFLRDFLHLEMINAAYYNGLQGNASAFQFKLVYGSRETIAQEETESVLSKCLPYNHWYTVCAVYDIGQNATSLYVDGHLQSTVSHALTVPWAATGQYPLIGRISYDPINPLMTGSFHGKVDYLKVFKRALLPEEIAVYTVPLADTTCGQSVSTFFAQYTTTIRAYPNPATEQVLLETGNQDGPFRLQVTDTAGRIMWVREVYADNGLLSVPITDLQGGVYLLYLLNNLGQTYIAKAVVVPK
jgi:hypothetical protein